MISNVKAGEQLGSCKGRTRLRDFARLHQSRVREPCQQSGAELEDGARNHHLLSYPTDKDSFNLQSQPDSTTLHHLLFISCASLAYFNWIVDQEKPENGEMV